MRASHVNAGTGVPHDELPWPEHKGPVMRQPKLHVEVDDRSVATPYGGLCLVAEFCRSLRVAETIDEQVEVLKLHLPYHESDHVLAQALNLYAGGTCLEDTMFLQKDEAVLRIFGACRLPDPTTAGDFLRRFDEQRNPGSLAALRRCIDSVQEKVWRRLSKRRRRRSVAVVHLDGHIKAICGVQLEGADFAYNGKYGFNVLLATLRDTGECLGVRLRPGSVRSSDGTAGLLEEILPRLRQQFDEVLVVADSDFDRVDVRRACNMRGVFFAFVGRNHQNRPALADEVTAWRDFLPRARRQRDARRARPAHRTRKRKSNRRRVRAAQRGYKERRLVRQFVGEVPWTPPDAELPLRLIVRRQMIDRIEHKQGRLFDEWRDRYVVTDLPPSWSVEDVIDEVYVRCDQENDIAQLGTGIAMWRMPVKEFAGNEAWLEIARLAWNFRVWIAQLALPEETLHWEWKRFRNAFVYAAAQVVMRARQVWLRFAASHRFVHMLAHALAHL